MVHELPADPESIRAVTGKVLFDFRIWTGNTNGMYRKKVGALSIVISLEGQTLLVLFCSHILLDCSST